MGVFDGRARFDAHGSTVVANRPASVETRAPKGLLDARPQLVFGIGVKLAPAAGELDRGDLLTAYGATQIDGESRSILAHVFQMTVDVQRQTERGAHIAVL